MEPVLIKVMGKALPSPTKYDLKLIDIDSPSTGRGDSGFLTRDRVRSDVASLAITWTMLTTQQVDAIQSVTKDPSFSVDYYVGGKTGQERRTSTMYAGDRNLSLGFYEGTSARWNLTLSLIEL